MRTRHVGFTAALLLASTAPAGAQPAPPAGPAPAFVDLGLRISSIEGDPARFQRFRDLGDGAFIDRLRFERDGKDWRFELAADHVGRLDQRYFGEYRGNGRLKVAFLWDQVPLFISRDTRTLFSTEAPGVLRIPDEIQGAIQNGQLRLGDVTGQAGLLEVRSRRDVALFDVVYSATRDVDVKFSLRNVRREGSMPWGATFGFSNDVEVAAPIDTRTTDLNASVEWAKAQGMLRVGYTGSWFENHVQTLIWDNPWKLSDLPAGSIGSQGRSALWPSNSLRSLGVAGSIKLPAHSRATANVSIGGWRQNEPLLPYTINSAVPATPLERSTAEAEARTLAMNYVLTSRPHRYVWLNARYRYYDFDNRTPPFDAEGFVLLDQRISAGSHSEPLSSTRHNLDLDASFTPVAFTALKVGYGREQVDRTFRIFERTTDDVFRASIDSTLVGWLTARAIFEHAARSGAGFEEEHLLEMGEQPAVRHYDIADRDRNRVTGLVQITPMPALGVSASIAAGKDDYRNSGFGLRDNENRIVTLGLDVTPIEQVAAGLTYAYERYTALQNSRNAIPISADRGPIKQFTDPRRDWAIDSADRVHTIAANVDLLKLLARTNVRLSYDFTRSKAAYVYRMPADSVLAVPQQLPPVTNELQSGTADVRYFLTSKLAVGLVYWYDRYRVDDFALGPSTIDRIDLPGSLFLGYVYRPYTAHSGWLRLTYLW